MTQPFMDQIAVQITEETDVGMVAGIGRYRDQSGRCEERPTLPSKSNKTWSESQ